MLFVGHLVPVFAAFVAGASHIRRIDEEERAGAVLDTNHAQGVAVFDNDTAQTAADSGEGARIRPVPLLRRDRRMALCAPARGMAGRASRLDRLLPLPALQRRRESERRR
ncbi:MAG: hypothetical protein LBU76_09340 [Azoarcus sp.]|nr:hypothetical protein [Azoarcus sp.]